MQMDRDYKEILRWCKDQKIDITDCHIYINNTLDGVPCLKGTLSKDGHWMCIPIAEYDEFVDEIYYIPRCFEIKGSLNTYLKNDDMWHFVVAFLLYKE